MRDEPMTASRAALVRLSAALARRDQADLRRVVGDCVLVCDPGEVEEVLLQSYLFLGYPIALNGIRQWREISGHPAPVPTDADWAGWEIRGKAVCQTVYGGQYGRLRTNIRGLHPDLERWMVIEGYGKVLGRPGLDLATRELCIGALLAVLDAPTQLYSHLRGALHAGASPEEIEASLEIACDGMESGWRAEVFEVWGRVRERSF